MAYIAPSTTIQFFKNTGLSPSHENTLYFADESTKSLYFTNWATQVGVVNQTYQRGNRSFCRIQSTMAVMYNVDYMRFINTQFENKWFYAFVVSINYINNNTIEVEYVLDPIMTWMGVFTLKQCFIERQHVLNDSIGANIAEEGISVGPYIDEAVEASPNYGRDACMIRVMVANPNETQANLFGGIYNPCDYHDFSDGAGAANYISSLVESNQVDNIVNVYMIPTKFANPGQIQGEFVQWSKPYSTVGGYTPKNKKLFCYPYKYLMVDNGEGNSQEYKYEFFNTVPDTTSTGNFEFQIYGITGNNVQVKCAPLSYNGNTDEAWYTDEYSLSMTHFPQCAWSVDTYSAYLAQKNAYLEHDVLQQNPVVGGAMVGSYAGEAGTVASTLGGVALSASQGIMNIGHNLRNTSETLKMTQDNLIDNIVRPESGTQLKGSSATDLTFSQAQKKFFFHEKTITKNYAMMIDNYFTMYGYRIGQVGTPNMNTRPHWTYVKTVGCDVSGNVPASDKKEIENIFDSGVRFWHNLNEMGDYSLDNSPA